MSRAPDPVVEANRQLLLERSRVGVEKYGVTLAASGLDRRALLRHALEESLDLSNYLQAELMRSSETQSAPASDQDYIDTWGLVEHALNEFTIDDGTRQQFNLAVDSVVRAVLATAGAGGQEPYGYVLKTGHGVKFAETLQHVHPELRHMWVPVYKRTPAADAPC